ncbi:MAG TPA: histidine triad nucleotide-binding protein [Candidatus Limnocylindrales bacterium]|nr:histidine triad nucleotide-binding protein [Candidatus Limnocylindrales bacterium]
MTNGECLFCRIAAGEIPAEIVLQDDLVLAFADINPKAPTHLLLIPRKHIESAKDLTEEDGPMLGRLFAVAARLAGEAGISEHGFRLVTNSGAGAGQSVFHIHFHLLGGRQLGWPPG